jgi:ABC-type oligopeptide transport system substrate-binding subunit
VLLIVGHPSIGAALETLLRIEDRYETRRVQSLDHLRTAGAGGWSADLALVDGLLIETGKAETLTMPAMVLSGNAADGARLAATLSNGRGWLRKDATADDLRTAIERALHRGGAVRAARLGRPVMLAAAAVIVGLLTLAVLVFRG